MTLRFVHICVSLSKRNWNEIENEIKSEIETKLKTKVKTKLKTKVKMKLKTKLKTNLKWKQNRYWKWNWKRNRNDFENDFENEIEMKMKSKLKMKFETKLKWHWKRNWKWNWKRFKKLLLIWNWNCAWKLKTRLTAMGHHRALSSWEIGDGTWDGWLDEHRGGCRLGWLGRSPPPKPTQVTLFTMVFYNLENSIGDIEPFCCPLFCHNSVAKYPSSFLQ